MILVWVAIAFIVGLFLPSSAMIGGAYYFKKHPEILIKAVARMARKNVRREAEKARD